MVDRFKDLIRYQGSVAASVLAKAEQVRNLLGTSHFPADGTYRERLIRASVRDALPSQLTVGDGFIVYPGIDGHEPAVSDQIDVLVYDDTIVPPLFRDESFAIVLPTSVVAAFEIQSTLNDAGQEIEESIEKLGRACLLAKPYRHESQGDVFSALVAFDCECYPQVEGRPNKSTLTKVVGHIAKAVAAEGMPFATPMKDQREAGALLKTVVPNVIASLSERWALVPAIQASKDGKFHCPVVTELESVTQDESGADVNHALHIVLALLQQTVFAARQFQYDDGVRELAGRLLTSLLAEAGYSWKDRPWSLLPKSERAAEIFGDRIQFPSVG